MQELSIHRSDGFIKQQDLRVDAGDHADCESHPHAGGVGPQRHREVIAELSEFSDLVDL
jgi:hypothetical protein